MANDDKKKRGLGRGLSALMSDVADFSSTTGDETPLKRDEMIAIDLIHPNPHQPRRSFDEDDLRDLAASIRAKGVIQSLILRSDPSRLGHFQIVAGERRWRAAQLAGLHELPVVVKEFDDAEVLELAIIENIQRSDLNAVDEALAYQQLMDRFGHTQEKLAQELGKSRSHIANLLRLLVLPNDVQELLIDGKISAGHARTLVGHDDASRLAKKIVKDGLSVRATERIAKASKEKMPGPVKHHKQDKDADTVQIERDLSAQLKMPVNIAHKPGAEGGSVTLSYKNLEQLDDLLRLLSGG